MDCLKLDMTILIIILLWVIYESCKALCDSRRDGEKVVRPWLEKHYGAKGTDWYDGQKRGLLTTTYNPGYFWSSDYWHCFDNIRGMCVAALMFSALALVSWSWWAIILFVWFCWWMPVFQLLYHVYLMRDWTWKRFLNDLNFFKNSTKT
jgi:hypothetical protein